MGRMQELYLCEVRPYLISCVLSMNVLRPHVFVFFMYSSMPVLRGLWLCCASDLLHIFENPVSFRLHDWGTA